MAKRNGSGGAVVGAIGGAETADDDGGPVVSGGRVEMRAVPVPLPTGRPAAVVPVVLDPRAVVPGPAAAAPGDPGQCRHVVLGPDLLRGTPGNLVTLPGDRILSNGRWAARFHVWRPADRAILHDPVKLARWVARMADVIGYGDRTELADGTDSADVRAAVLGMLTPAPGAAPYDRTGLVLDAPDVAEAYDDPSEFFRVYVGPGGAVVLVPDAYVQGLGDPDRLWPSAVPGCVTDGLSGFMVAGGALADRVSAFVDSWAAARAATPKAAPAETAPKAAPKGKRGGAPAGGA